MNAINIQMLVLLIALLVFVAFAARELRVLWTAVNSISQAMYQDGKATRQLAERLRKLEDDGK